MKLSKTSHKSITAAEEKVMATLWYRVTMSQFADFIEKDEPNLFVRYTALSNYFDCLDLSQMYGSAIYDHTLYICDTNGQPIIVDNKDDVDPETAFKHYTPEDLQVYIIDADEKILLKYITYREMDQELLEDERIDAAIEALQSGDYTIEDVIKDYNEIW